MHNRLLHWSNRNGKVAISIPKAVLLQPSGCMCTIGQTSQYVLHNLQTHGTHMKVHSHEQNATKSAIWNHFTCVCHRQRICGNIASLTSFITRPWRCEVHIRAPGKVFSFNIIIQTKRLLIMSQIKHTHTHTSLVAYDILQSLTLTHKFLVL